MGMGMAGAATALVVVLLLQGGAGVLGNDPDALQDVCVADLNSTVKVNGEVCKDAAAVTAADFMSSFLAKPGNTSNKLGSAVTLANVAKFPGLNTLGVSMARIDYAAHGGLNPPHVHPRATELLYLLHGSLYVGFVTTQNKLFATTIQAGDLFVFPKGLVHFQLNSGRYPAVGIAALTSQNPGTSQVAKALFASSPSIEDAVLETSFQLPRSEIEKLKSRISMT